MRAPEGDRLPVAIIGGGAAPDDAPECRAAYEVARGLAEAGLVIVCGGRGGVMAAACRGARDGGGISIAVLPRLAAAEANPYATVVLPTDLGDVRTPLCRAPEVSRNRVIAACGRCVVALGGGRGTANEIGHALRFGKTVFGLCGAPEPAPAPPADPRPVTGVYLRVGSAAEAIERVLSLGAGASGGPALDGNRQL